jgi:copper chaperone CopZ
MKKIIKIEGMSCGHCQAKVEKVLNALDGVEAKVDLKKKAATVNLLSEVSDTILRDVVTEAGYEVVSIEEKKGLFGK